MKRVGKNKFYVIGALIVMLLISSCGKKHGVEGIPQEFENVGLDDSCQGEACNPLSPLMIPQCSDDSRDASVAIKVEANTTIQPSQAHTTLRVWHYQNRDKLVCVITGLAYIANDNKS